MVKGNLAYDVPRPAGELAAVVGAEIVRVSDNAPGVIEGISEKHHFRCRFDDEVLWLYRLEFRVPNWYVQPSFFEQEKALSLN